MVRAEGCEHSVNTRYYFRKRPSLLLFAHTHSNGRANCHGNNYLLRHMSDIDFIWSIAPVFIRPCRTFCEYIVAIFTYSIVLEYVFRRNISFRRLSINIIRTSTRIASIIVSQCPLCNFVAYAGSLRLNCVAPANTEINKLVPSTSKKMLVNEKNAGHHGKHSPNCGSINLPVMSSFEYKIIFRYSNKLVPCAWCDYHLFYLLLIIMNKNNNKDRLFDLGHLQRREAARKLSHSSSFWLWLRLLWATRAIKLLLWF